MKQNDTYLITPGPHRYNPAELAKRLGITEEQLHEHARKQIEELLALRPEEKLTPRKLEQIRKRIRKAEAARAKAMRKAQRTSELPFPLPDIYDEDDSLLPREALYAVKAYRLLLLRFGPDRDQDEDQLKKATDVALGIRLAWSGEWNVELAEVPLAKDFKRPTDEDFVRLEQWFLTTANAIKKEIARCEPYAAGRASDARQGGGKATGKPDVAIAKARSRSPGVCKVRDVVFICYCNKDKKWLEEMRTMLAPVIRRKVLSVWHDRKIKPGEKWRSEIAKALRKTRVGVLLVTKNFLASEFINEVELKYLLRNAKTIGIKLLPVYVGHCMWKHSPLAEVQFVNDTEKPLGQYRGTNLDKHLKEVCEKIEKAYRKGK
jgi:hypothetical protein